MAESVSYRDLSLGHARLRVDAPWADSALENWFDPATPALQAQRVGVGGRQAAWFVSGPFGQGVLRHYQRGGWVAHLSRDRYVWQGPSRVRAMQEFDILNWMQSQGLPVPRAVAAAYWRQGLSYRAAIIVQRLAGTTTLGAKQAHADAVAQAIHAMHQADVWHADLNAHNILLDAQGQAWLIDFDRARRLRMTSARRRANLLRLRRSLQKIAGSSGLGFWQQVDRIYHSL